MRIEDEHAAAMENVRKDLGLLVNALGGRAQLDVEDFSSISPPKREGALDVTDVRIKKLTEAQAKLVAEFQRVEDLETRADMTMKELKEAEAKLKTMAVTESEFALKIASHDKWKNKVETRIDDVDHVSRAAATAAAAAAEALVDIPAQIAAAIANTTITPGSAPTAAGMTEKKGSNARANAFTRTQSINAQATTSFQSTDENDASGFASNTLASTVTPHQSQTTHAKSLAAAAAAAAATPVVKGVSKEEMEEMQLQLKGLCVCVCVCARVLA